MTVRGAKTIRKCKRCGDPFTARVADVKRGWAKFCSKSCKAVAQVQKGGQYVRYQYGPPRDNELDIVAHSFPDDDINN